MSHRDWTLGSRIDHPVHGKGTVSYVGADRIGISFDDGRELLIRQDALERDLRRTLRTGDKTAASWPESTFIEQRDPKPRGHLWDPFVDDPLELLVHLQSIMPNAIVTESNVMSFPTRTEPAHWPKGTRYVFPTRDRGIALVTHDGAQSKKLVALFPFFATESQCTLVLRAVKVGTSGLDAQIEADWGEARVTFYDTEYVLNRAFYEAGRSYDFVLAGLAFSATPATDDEVTVTHSPETWEWMNEKGVDLESLPKTLKLKGAAIFLPSGGNSDEYAFRVPVKSVEPFGDWLGQDGWRVRATIMRFADFDADLDILITRQAWTGSSPPQVGQDIEGRLWLQGRLSTVR